MRDLSGERGSATVAGILATLILVVIAAGIVDLYRIQDLRTFAYGVATDAALQGASAGRDWPSYLNSGRLTLNATQATNAAAGVVTTAMAGRGITGYRDDIRVITGVPSDPTSYGYYPPVARASQFAASDCPGGVCTWTASQPSVGVYIQITVPTLLFGIINGNQPVQVNVFAASGVVPQ